MRTDDPYLSFRHKLVDSLIKAADSFCSTRLDVDSIIAAAIKGTGLSNLGSLEFLDRMEALVSHADTLPLRPMGRFMFFQTWTDAVAQRLRAIEFLSNRPKVKTTPIQRPLFVVGLPRSGTTALQRMLAMAPGKRGLQFWELAAPVPDLRRSLRVDRLLRLWRAKGYLALTSHLIPQMAQVHPVNYDTLEECWFLFAGSFGVYNWELFTGPSNYGNRLLTGSVQEAYCYYLDLLKILHHDTSDLGLVLKNPDHLWFLDTLTSVFQDSDPRIVWIHREPDECIASYADMLGLYRKLCFSHYSEDEMVDHIADGFTRGLQLAMDFRDRKSHNICDLRFSDFRRDPIGSLRDIHAHFHMPFRVEYEAMLLKEASVDRTDGPDHHTYQSIVTRHPSETEKSCMARYRETYLGS